MSSDKTAKSAFFNDASCISTEAWGHEWLTDIDSTTGYYFSDIEKTAETDADDNSCWLTSASNMLYWSGWATAGDPTLKSEDAFFEYANSCWGANDGGYEQAAYNWWLTGKSGFSNVVAPSGGGKFATVITSTSKYCLNTSISNRGAISSLFSCIEGGYGVTLAIRGIGISHAITCWGYEIVSDNIYLYYSDSDDNEISGDRSGAPDELKKTLLTYNTTTKRYYLTDYIVSGIYLAEITAIAQYDKIFSGLHETFDDARDIVASGESQSRRGKIDGDNDDDYYVISGTGRGACFTILAWGDSSPYFTVDLYEADQSFIGTIASTHSCVGSFTTSEDGEKYYIKVSGTATGQLYDLTNNVYEITIENNRWRTEWTHIENSSEVIEIVADNTAPETYIADEDKYAKTGYCAAAIVGLGNRGYRRVCGGPSSGTYTGDIRLCANETTVRTLYGGGAAGSTVAGNIYLELVSGVDVSAALFGGGASTVTGNIYITAETGGGTANFFGGSLNASVSGKIDIAMTNGRYTGLIVGGGRSGAAGTPAAAGDIAITVSGTFVHTPNIKLLASGISSWIVGGGQASTAGAITAGNVAITVSGGAEANFIVGGGQASGDGSTAAVAGVSITVSGAKVTGNIFGGGYAFAGGTASVSGDVSITIDASTTETSLLGNIYAGGANPRHAASGGSSIVSGSATITFTGSAELLNFSGVVSGDGAVSGSVRGDSTLRFKDFSGEFSGTMKNFANLAVSGNSAVTLNNACPLIGLKYEISAIPDTPMLKCDSLDFEKLTIALDSSILTRNCAIQLWEGEEAAATGGLTAALTDADGVSLGSLTVNDRNKIVGIANGKLGLAADNGRMYLYFTLNT
ncbi:MAG: hypothetical protein PHI85_00480 [Victivallaceae bacterium]|nr:hypothetical protein [Victivallaceae bacterium]